MLVIATVVSDMVTSHLRIFHHRGEEAPAAAPPAAAPPAAAASASDSAAPALVLDLELLQHYHVVAALLQEELQR